YLYNPNFSNVVVTADWTFYEANISYLPSLPPLLPQATYTNLPGRIQIDAETVDMTRTRIRAQGQVVVNARHMISTSNAIVDSPNLAYNLASTNDHLLFANLAQTMVDRFSGDLLAYSAVWQNQAYLNTESWAITTNLDTNGAVSGIGRTLVPITNAVDLNLH